MRKARNKQRKPRNKQMEPDSKRRRTGLETSSSMQTTWIMEEECGDLEIPARNEAEKPGLRDSQICGQTTK